MDARVPVLGKILGRISFGKFPIPIRLKARMYFHNAAITAITQVRVVSSKEVTHISGGIKLGSLDEPVVIAAARKIASHMIMHELDEFIEVDGQNVYDPHDTRRIADVHEDDSWNFVPDIGGKR